MPYVYEGEDTVRVQGQRYSKGDIREEDDVKDKKGWRKVNDDEAEKIANDRPGTFADAQPDSWQGKFAAANEWMSQATVATGLNRVIGDNEAPYGPPSGTITTKQAVMRAAENSAERTAFGPNEWLPEDAEERNLADLGSSGQVQAAQAEAQGKTEKLTEELLGNDGGGNDEPKQSRRGRRPASDSTPS